MLKHKFLTTSITLLSLGMLTAQEQEPEKGLYIKGNALLATIGVLNVGLENRSAKSIHYREMFSFLLGNLLLDMNFNIILFLLKGDTISMKHSAAGI